MSSTVFPISGRVACTAIAIFWSSLLIIFKISFIQIPQNLPRFFEYEIDDKIYFIPIENIIKKYINKLFRNVKIISVSLFRLIRNGDFTLEESEDIETNFLEELKQKLKDRKSIQKFCFFVK